MYYQVGNCPGHTHCGLITYVHNSFKSNEININYDATGWEHLTIEISYNSPNAKKYLVLNIYKLPEKYVAELDEFITEFSSFLTLLQHHLFVEISTNAHFNNYFESIISKGFFPRITLPTRIQPPSFSLIDNILCNNIGGTVDSTSVLLINDISDHKMIFTHLPNDSYKNKVNKFIVMEKNNEASINNFCNELGSLNINDHLDKRLNLDPNDNYELFVGLIKYARKKHLPKIKVKYNKKKHSFSTSMTNEILQSINQKTDYIKF